MTQSGAACRPTARPESRRWLAGLALVVLFTFAVRSAYFGNPVVNPDEDFYLLVGDRWLHGAIPYVDIWDRKPPGLFLIYALIRLLGGSGIIQYQLAATAAAAATAALIAIMARRIAGPLPAIGAALVYPLALGWSGGVGGQSPVFYNLPMALAALLLLGLLPPRRDDRLVQTGTAAMLLVGLAMQIKYSALYEGVYFGLVLLWLAWRRGNGWPRVAMLGALWIASALLPTAIALAGFALAGHGAAFVFANFTSILLRTHEPLSIEAFNLGKMLTRLSPMLLALIVGLILGERPWRGQDRRTAAHRFLLGWAGASLLGILLFRDYFNHYALPLLVPLTVVTGPAFACSRYKAGVWLAASVLTVNGIAYVGAWRYLHRRDGGREYADRIVAEIRPRLHGGKLFVFNGEPSLYYLTGSALPTRWPFPYHLSLRREATALGVDADAEARRIMISRPTVVVDTFQPDSREINLETQAIVRYYLRRDYRLVASFPLQRRVRQVYALAASR